jgi:hypothetical protein
VEHHQEYQYIHYESSRRKKGKKTEGIFQEIRGKTFPSLMKDIALQETQ